MTRNNGIVLALAAFLLASPAFAADEVTAPKKTPFEDAILKGSEYVQKKDYEKAVVEFERAAKINPKSPKAYLLLGLTYANMGKLDLAVKNSGYSVVLEPSYAGYHNLGLIYANKGDYDRAADSYEKALEINPTSYRGWYEYGLVEAGNANFQDAVKHYKKSVELNPNFAEAYLGLGSASYWTGDKAGAAQQVAKLNELGHKDKAAALESWIADKEAKKASGKAPAPSTEPVPAKA